MLNKTLAGFFAFFLGMFGVHYFYVGKQSAGASRLFAFFAFAFSAANTPDPISSFAGMLLAALVISSMITGIVWWSQPLRRWQAKYDPEALENTGQHTVGQANFTDVSALTAEGIRYYRSADYDLAIEAFLEAAEADVSDPSTHFNLACSYAQLGQYPEALRHLELSVTFGLPKPHRIQKHPALAALRKLQAFEDFRANNYRRLNFLEAPAATPPPPTEVREDFSTPPRSEAPPASEPTYDDAPPPGPDLLEQITRLRELHDAGILTQLEYQKQKEKLLG